DEDEQEPETYTKSTARGAHKHAVHPTPEDEDTQEPETYIKATAKGTEEEDKEPKTYTKPTAKGAQKRVPPPPEDEDEQDYEKEDYQDVDEDDEDAQDESASRARHCLHEKPHALSLSLDTIGVRGALLAGMELYDPLVHGVGRFEEEDDDDDDDSAVENADTTAKDGERPVVGDDAHTEEGIIPSVKARALERLKKKRAGISVESEHESDDPIELDDPSGNYQESDKESEPQSDGHNSRTSKQSKKQKGKGVGSSRRGKTIHGDESDDELPVDETEDWAKRPGPISLEARQEIKAFAISTMAEARTIAAKYGKSARTILIEAGLGLKPTRAPNRFNMHSTWYSHKYPKDMSCNLQERNEKQTAHYRALAVDDPLWEEIEACGKQLQVGMPLATRTTKAITSRVLAARDAFAKSASSYSQFEDIEVVGIVVYTGSDAGGAQSSGLFAGSDIARQIINDKQVDVQRLVDYASTVFKYKTYEESAAVQLPVFNDLSVFFVTGKQTIRDCDRRIMTKMFTDKLGTLGITVTQGIWVGFLDAALKDKLCIDNWPPGAHPLGPDFDSKRGLAPSQLRAIVYPYMARKMGTYFEAEVKGRRDGRKKKSTEDGSDEDEDLVSQLGPEIVIRKWDTKWMDMPDSHPDKGSTPLIVDTTGKVVRTLRESEAWQKQRATATQAPRAAPAKRGPRPDQPSAQAPAPSAASNVQTTRPRPRPVQRGPRPNTPPPNQDPAAWDASPIITPPPARRYLAQPVEPSPAITPPPGRYRHGQPVQGTTAPITPPRGRARETSPCIMVPPRYRDNRVSPTVTMPRASSPRDRRGPTARPPPADPTAYYEDPQQRKRHQQELDVGMDVAPREKRGRYELSTLDEDRTAAFVHQQHDNTR
ncbi:hypothetical protein BJ138DRAFT_1120416, partial [Hygrophoropsis aurantiaca]